MYEIFGHLAKLGLEEKAAQAAPPPRASLLLNRNDCRRGTIDILVYIKFITLVQKLIFQIAQNIEIHRRVETFV